MKKLLLLLALLSPGTAFCAIDTIPAASHVTGATVFFTGAQVTRHATLKTTRGKHILRLDNLHGEINPQSIQVNRIDRCRILSVKHQVVYPNPNKKEPDETELQNAIDQQIRKIKEIRNRSNVFDIEEKLLIDNSHLKKGDNGAAIADIKEAADFYRARLNEIRQGKLDLAAVLDDAEKKLQDLYARINALTSSRHKATSRVMVAVECDDDLNADLSITYYVPSAGWTPTYDFRVDEITKPLTIVYNANVFQSSGEDWNSIDMKLSTSNPSLSGEKPELPTWYLDQRTAFQPPETRTGAGVVKGRVLDTGTNEPIAFANVIIERGGVQVGGTTTDFDGVFTIKPVPSGACDLRASYVGYRPFLVKGLLVAPDKITFQELKMEPSSTQLNEVEVVNYKVPLISKDQTSSTIIGGDDIRHTPDLSSAATTVGGVSSAGTSMRGQRSSGQVYYIDGMRTVSADAIAREQESRVTVSDYIGNSVMTNVANLEYTIDIPYTIPSDGQDYAIKIKEAAIPVNYLYHAVPRADRDAFLSAELTDWSRLNLLSGKSGIYYQGTYTGGSVIDADRTSDTLNISLGRDRSIVVEREGNKEVFDRRVVGNNIRETVGWKITVRNNKETRIRISVEDQFPMAVKRSIEVERLEYTGAKLDDETGKLKWMLELDPGEKKTVTFKYSVKYPRNMNLSLE